MKFILVSGSILMTAAGALGLVDFKEAFDKGELTFLQGNDKANIVENQKALTHRDRRISIHHDNHTKQIDFYMESFSRGAIDYYSDYLVDAEDELWEY